jgi:membrane protease YdiL (CAAX protease family)
MTLPALARIAGPIVFALGTALYFDRSLRVRRLMPPGFAASGLRRAVAFLALAAFLWVGVFAALGVLGKDVAIDPTKLSTPELFFLHMLMLLTLGAWFLLGFAGQAGTPPLAAPPPSPAPELAPLPLSGAAIAAAALQDGEGGRSGWESPIETPEQAPEDEPALVAGVAAEGPAATAPAPRSLGRRFAEQFGLAAPSIPTELGLGAGLGIGAWAGVLAVMVMVAFVLVFTGQMDVKTQEMPPLVPWLASRPFLLRLAISLAAGFCEELFFRGFLQPRVGILVSTALFTLAHLTYGQPFLLIGIALLSLIYGLLVRWRQSIWAAVAAHSLFDGIQLLILVPAVVRYMDEAGKGAGTALLALLRSFGLC